MILSIRRAGSSLWFIESWKDEGRWWCVIQALGLKLGLTI